jgi:hypothetical protein
MSSLLQECQHETIEKGECLACGFMINGGVTLKMTEEYAPYHKEPFIPLQNLEKDLSRVVGIEDDIRRQALQLGLKCSSNLNILGTRNAQLFALIYMAYLHKQREFDPTIIAKELNLNKRQINAIQKQVTGVSSRKYFPSNVSKPSIVIISPIIHIPKMCDQLGIMTYEKIISEWGELALDKDQSLFEERPDYIAAAIIKYIIKRFSIKINNFELVTGITSASIRKHIKLIGQILDPIQNEKISNIT